MTKLDYTPGPRCIRTFTTLVEVWGSSRPGEWVGTFRGSRRAGNARLDAAAPDLLRVCESLEPFLTSLILDGFQRRSFTSDDFRCVYLRLLTAIKKATGEESHRRTRSTKTRSRRKALP